MRAPTVPRFPDVPGLAKYLEDLSRFIDASQTPQMGSQPYNGNLQAISGLVGTADKVPYFTGAEAMALTGLTAAGRALIDDANAAAQLTTLGISAFVQTLLDDVNAAAVLATLGIVASTYTPTLTGEANVTASTAFAVPYIRVGSIVLVGVFVNIDPNLFAPTSTALGISLPVASNLANANELVGTATQGGAVNYAAKISANVANDRATLLFSASSGTAVDFTGSFIYGVLP